jgi:hypothetical protein
MRIALLPSLKKIGLHLWQLLHGNDNKRQFWLIKGHINLTKWSPQNFKIELGRVLYAYNLVTMFKVNRFTFVAVIARKRKYDGRTDRRTDKPKLIYPDFFFEKAGHNNYAAIIYGPHNM